MNDAILILLTILVAANVVLVAIIAFRVLVPDGQQPRLASLSPAGPATRSSGAPATIAVDTSPPPSRTDAQTGLLLPGEWNRILGDEDARIKRYGRPATIVLIELDGLDRLISALGDGAADRILLAVADSLSHHARGSDHLARLGAGRFGVLLPETDEVEAVNYVERIRSACDLWLETGAIALRLAIGWAAPPADGSLGDAVATAQERMYAELRRNGRTITEPAAPVTPVASDLARWAPTA